MYLADVILPPRNYQKSVRSGFFRLISFAQFGFLKDKFKISTLQFLTIYIFALLAYRQ